jgi:hypothetical protein
MMKKLNIAQQRKNGKNAAVFHFVVVHLLM